MKSYQELEKHLDQLLDGLHAVRITFLAICHCLWVFASHRGKAQR